MKVLAPAASGKRIILRWCNLRACGDYSEGKEWPEPWASMLSTGGLFGVVPSPTNKGSTTASAGFSFGGGHKKKENSADVGFAFGVTSVKETATEKKG